MPGAYDPGEALDARLPDRDDLLQLADWHCGFASLSAGCGLSHRIAQVRRDTCGLSYDMACAVTLGPVLRESHDRHWDRLSRFDDGPAFGAAERLAKRIDTIASRLPRVAALLTRRYPGAVADLGDDATARLDALLDSIG